MKTIKEAFPNLEEDQEGYSYLNNKPDYTELIDSLGYEVLSYFTLGSYRGDFLYLLKDNTNNKYGFLVFGYGSCSGCDALQACRRIDSLDSLRDSLNDSIHWDTQEGLLKYFVEKDFKVEYYYSLDDEKAKEAIEAFMKLLK